VGSTQNNKTLTCKPKVWGNPQGVFGTQPKTPIEKITSKIPDSPSRVDSATDAIIDSSIYEYPNPKNQGYHKNPIEETNHSIESNESSTLLELIFFIWGKK
jgi:hypothetical protein